MRRLLWLDIPKIDLSKGQMAMAKGCRTIYLGIIGDLISRGVIVIAECNQGDIR